MFAQCSSSSLASPQSTRWMWCRRPVSWDQNRHPGTHWMPPTIDSSMSRTRSWNCRWSRVYRLPRQRYVSKIYETMCWWRDRQSSMHWNTSWWWAQWHWSLRSGCSESRRTSNRMMACCSMHISTWSTPKKWTQRQLIDAHTMNHHCVRVCTYEGQRHANANQNAPSSLGRYAFHRDGLQIFCRSHSHYAVAFYVHTNAPFSYTTNQSM